MTNDKNINSLPISLPPVERVRKDEFEFLKDLVIAGSELRTTIAECAMLAPVVKYKPENSAVLTGLMVRLYKLFDTFLLLICERRMEMAMILARSAYETAIDILFFCHTKDESKVTEFINTTLATSKKIFENVERDEKAGKGNRNIRLRIKSSVEYDFGKAGRVTDDIQSSEWHRPDSLYKRAESVKLEETYTFLYRSLSRVVHSSWSELVKYHLVEGNKSWWPNLKYNVPRSQIFSSFPILVAMAAKAYSVDIANCHAMSDRIKIFIDWFIEMSDRHEEFLKTNNKGSTNSGSGPE